MKNIIAGTAGHIDHGKTSLVKALTGVDTDRLKEEKERGISIDLGFAKLDAGADLRIGFVDVPGHERFVRNMLAGATGIDMVILVVAADDGIKPQTREHFDICRLLGVEAGMVALTKADLVDEDWLGLVRMDVEEMVRGSFLEGAPMVAVSTITGDGLDEVRREILAAGERLRARDIGRPGRLPIDRSFVMKGHGTVVTGTLREGTIALQGEVELYPAGRVVRIRGLHVHGEPVRVAEAGQRVAMNLGGVEAGEVVRGFVAGPPGLYEPVTVFDARIEVLASVRDLRDKSRVRFHCGTAEMDAGLRLLFALPGKKAWVRVVLSSPALLLPGDRFILRALSPVQTVAGGTIEEIHLGKQRLRRKGASERLDEWTKLTMTERIRRYVEASPVGIDFAVVRRRLGCIEAEIPQDLVRIGGWLAAPDALKKVGTVLVESLRRFHREQPLLAGMSREAARTALLAGAPPALLDAVMRYVPAVKADGEVLRLESHRVNLVGEEEAAAGEMARLFAAAGLEVPALADVLASTKLDGARARSLLALLLRKGDLVRVGNELIFHRAAILGLKQAMAKRKGQRFGVAEFKQWVGVSRKYAIPLLEFLDRERVTRREGDQRIVL